MATRKVKAALEVSQAQRSLATHSGMYAPQVWRLDRSANPRGEPPVKMPPANRAAPNVDGPRSGPRTLDPGQRARRTAQTTRQTTPPATMPDPRWHGSKDRDYYANLMMKHYGI